MNLKKMTASVALVALAATTGFTVGKMYVDSSTISMISVNATEQELRDDDATIAALVKRSETEDVTNFNAIELFQIAEYNLANSDCFMKEMIGTTNSASVDLGIRSQKIKMDGSLVYYKLSPEKNVVILTTPNIAAKTEYNYSSPNEIKVTNGTYSCFLDTSSTKNLDADFSSCEAQTYTSEEYLSTYKTTPDSSIMPYIISTKTCSEDNYSAVTENSDGTYSFEFSFSGNSECAYPALYYTYEILTTCGYTNPSLQWSSFSITVTIDEDFNFVSVSYIEKYSLKADDLPLPTVTVVDTFDETFYYDRDTILARAISDYKEAA